MHRIGRLGLSLGLGVALVLAVVWAAGGLAAVQADLTAAQRAAQSSLAGAIKALRSGQPGAWAGLVGVCFAYGFLHAAGPGHGKMVIGGYGMAERVRLVPLMAVAVLSSLAQALVAVVFVLGGVWLLGWGRDRLEWASGEVLAPLGTWMIIGLGLWIVLRGAMRVWRGGAVAHAGHGHDHGHHHHSHDHGHVHDAECGHAHGPSLTQMQGLNGWRDAVALIAAIALRPCTGALFVLIITQSMGLVLAGIVGALAMGLGTALVTVLVAALAVWAREGMLVNLPGSGVARALPVIEIAAGVAIVAAAAALLGRGA